MRLVNNFQTSLKNIYNVVKLVLNQGCYLSLGSLQKQSLRQDHLFWEVILRNKSTEVGRLKQGRRGRQSKDPSLI